MLPRTIHRIQSFAQRPIQRVTIKQLLGRSTALSEETHVQHAFWLREQATVRLAHRLAGFLELPYVVFCNTRFHEVFSLFLNSFELLADFKPISNMDDVADFATVLNGAYREHAELINMLQEGYSELQALLDNINLDAFLNKTFITRIGNRLLAEHFLALHEAYVRGDGSSSTGVVHPKCRPEEIVTALSPSLNNLFYEVYGVEAKIVVDGQLDTELPFIYDHLYFMLQEILKNAARATVEAHIDTAQGIPPVVVEIMKGSFDVILKVSDRGGGMTPEKLAAVWRYGYTSVGEAHSREAVSGGGLLSGMSSSNFAQRSVAGYGFGLPLSRVYAQYFGGDIVIQSMHGYGSDVYLNINHLGETLEVKD